MSFISLSYQHHILLWYTCNISRFLPSLLIHLTNHLFIHPLISFIHFISSSVYLHIPTLVCFSLRHSLIKFRISLSPYSPMDPHQQTGGGGVWGKGGRQQVRHPQQQCSDGTGRSLGYSTLQDLQCYGWPGQYTTKLVLCKHKEWRKESLESLMKACGK